MALDPKPVVLTTGPNPNPNLAPEPLIVVGGLPTNTQVAGLTPVTAADAVKAADQQPAPANPTKAEFDVLVTLANANKAKINEIITALKA